MAKKSKTPQPKPHRWSITLITGTPARFVGAVHAASEAEAIETAIRELKIRPELRNRIVARRDDL